MNVAPNSARWAWLQRPGPWFWALVALGLIGRIYLAIASAGTHDVEIWTEHAHGVAEHGLIRHYAIDKVFNHPPAIAWLMGRLWLLAQALGVEFAALYRALFALVDLASAFLILRILRESAWRYVAAGAYCVAPIALVLGACHGNTDALVASALLCATLCVGNRRPILAGIAIGISAWIKIPGLLAAPALGFAFPRWRDRIVCALVALAVALSTYFWTFHTAETFAASHPRMDTGGANLIVRRIFMYEGMFLRIEGEPTIWIWGLKSFLDRALGMNHDEWPSWAQWWLAHSHLVALPLMFVFGFLRRRDNGTLAIAATIAGTYAIFYALVETMAFQYFAWSMPFWMLAGWRYAVAANVLCGGYIYAFYAFASGDWLLRSAWRPLYAPDWPAALSVLRDAALLTFVTFAVLWFARAVLSEIAAARTRALVRA
jgi:hypothetical protein